MVNPSSGPGLRRPSGLFSFIREVFSELRKTAWPTREQTARLAFFVVIIVQQHITLIRKTKKYGRDIVY